MLVGYIELRTELSIPYARLDETNAQTCHANAIVAMIQTYAVIHFEHLTSAIGVDKFGLYERGDTPQAHEIVDRVFVKF